MKGGCGYAAIEVKKHLYYVYYEVFLLVCFPKCPLLPISFQTKFSIVTGSAIIYYFENYACDFHVFHIDGPWIRLSLRYLTYKLRYVCLYLSFLRFHL